MRYCENDHPEVYEAHSKRLATALNDVINTLDVVTHENGYEPYSNLTIHYSDDGVYTVHLYVHR